MELSRPTPTMMRTTQRPSRMNDTTHKPSRTNDATPKAVILKVTQLFSRSPKIWYHSFTYSSNHCQGVSVAVYLCKPVIASTRDNRFAWLLRYSFSEQKVLRSNLPSFNNN
ncbi:hypothetical protein TNCV_1931731 [Trichonephila clavipes]|nr:hypothetical protein TNCV_1931731 [Trichonephila clavipes]